MMETNPFSLEVADYLFERVDRLERVLLTWWTLLSTHRLDLIKTAVWQVLGNFNDTQTKTEADMSVY